MTINPMAPPTRHTREMSDSSGLAQRFARALRPRAWAFPARPQHHHGSGPLLSCVVDTQPIFQQELVRWFVSATECAGVPAERLVIHVISPTNSPSIQLVESKGARVVPIEPFDSRSPHCNKIAGALSLAKHLPATVERVALLDTDMLIMNDPTTTSPPAGSIAGKRVDLANPPLEVLHNVFVHAKLDPPPSLPAPEPTLLGNLNGGLYVINRVDLAPFASSWAKWATWMLDRSHLLGAFAVHVDQVAACLALSDLDLQVELLDQSWNLPTHLGSVFPPDLQPPKILHYHRRTTTDGLVELTGHDLVDEAIRRANDEIQSLSSLPD